MLGCCSCGIVGDTGGMGGVQERRRLRPRCCDGGVVVDAAGAEPDVDAGPEALRVHVDDLAGLGAGDDEGAPRLRAVLVALDGMVAAPGVEAAHGREEVVEDDRVRGHRLAHDTVLDNEDDVELAEDAPFR